MTNGKLLDRYISDQMEAGVQFLPVARVSEGTVPCRPAKGELDCPGLSKYGTNVVYWDEYDIRPAFGALRLTMFAAGRSFLHLTD